MVTIDKKRGKNQYSHHISLATVNNSYFHQGYCNEEMVVRRQWFRCVTKKVGRREKSKKTKGNNMHTHSYTQTWVRQMRAATRGLQLFIMKGIHRSVLALPLSTQFFHTGPPSLPLVPSLLSVPLFSLFNIFFFWIHFGAKEDWVCENRERERKWIERGRVWRREQICRTAWRPAWGHACHFSFHPSYLLAGLMRTRALTVPGHLRSSAGWVEEGWGSTIGLSTSLAARQSALWDPARLLDCRGHTHTKHPPTHWGAQSELRQDGRWGLTNTYSLYSLMHLHSAVHLWDRCIYAVLREKQELKHDLSILNSIAFQLVEITI